MVISNTEIHLWFFNDDDVKNSFMASECYRLLNSEELAKLERFKFAKHKHQYLMTRVMLRSVLSLYVDNIVPEEWQFTINEHGKPYICNTLLTTPLKFNISHTEKMIVLAVTLNEEVGVDVEYFPRMNGVLDIAKGFFSAIEVDQLFELPAEKQKDRFFDLWTLKEAYVKARGTGLTIPFNSFSCRFSDKDITFIFHDEPEQEDQPWRFWQIIPSDQHKMGLVIKDSNSDASYSVSMRNFISLSESIEVNYPIAQGRKIENY